jgi:hypothetical protein
MWRTVGEVIDPDPGWPACGAEADAPAGKCAVVEAGSTGERGTYHRAENTDKADTG